MRYIKAEEVLPPWLLEEIQKYVDGQSLYIPRKARAVAPRQTPYQAELRLRNAEIVRARRQGMTVAALAERFYLSEKSIARILRENQE